ncbi:tetratricopeptide repeat protein [Pseudoalteromonas sp. MMG013]|uniref:tetratricopeptide repeat protein n=1 Tax=unclassified Pseudoalteromonas TaxID=194690 RepID=UPI001B397EFE|nr:MULTISPECIES: tetratricopeptide repeat protein [unclassified Pseudoalteromonas]MBQ4851487.1 tetratricopeptide repeat protein [Pseudoalteromonas sp. MMG012]MBQ4864527.1 tetratricopeptide repeat protein [Pseudoalteromonas sp. MMG013]
MTDTWFEERERAQDYISQQTLLRCIGAESHWDAQAVLEHSYCQLAELELQVDQISHKVPDLHQRLSAILDAFYTQWLFCGSEQNAPEHQLNSVCYVLKMRSGSPTALSIVLCHLLERAGLAANLAMEQGEVMVHVGFSYDEGYIVEPCSGQQTWYIVPENEQEKQDEPLEIVTGDEAFKLYLAQQKWAFIAADKFGHALSCVELLMGMLGDDPYERRDRGYLLNQINCPKMAKEDLQYFVDECPDDPTIDIIEHQISELADHSHVLH